MPSIEELSLEEPEIVRQGGRYGVRLEASAPSIHMMKAVIHTEISPIVGTEKQSEDLARSLLAGFEDDPEKLWESNIFGKSLHELHGFIHVRFFVAGDSLIFKHFLYFGVLPVELVGILPLTAVVFFVGEGSLRRVPCSNLCTRLITVHFVNRFGGFFSIERRLNIGIHVNAFIHS